MVQKVVEVVTARLCFGPTSSTNLILRVGGHPHTVAWAQNVAELSVLVGRDNENNKPNHP